MSKIIKYSFFFLSIILFFLLADYRLNGWGGFRDLEKIYGSLKNPSPTENIKEPDLKPLSLETIFSKDHSWTDTLPKDKVTTLIATGDVIPARMVNYKSYQNENFAWAYEKTADFLNSADITIINLEAPIFEGCPLTMTGMIFCGDAKHIDGLKLSGVDVVNFANNHMGNYGVEGIEQTITLLEASDMLTSGINKITYKVVNGMTFAFAGYNSVGSPEEMIAWLDEKNVIRDIKKARTKADIVVVSFHWGEEYVQEPYEDQIRTGHLAIDSGADLVIGNHPHWIKPVEIYKERLIVYAHGNFIFDQMWSGKTKEGVIGKYTFYKNRLVDAEFIPVIIEDYGQPNFPDEKNKKRILQRMKQASQDLIFHNDNATISAR